MTEQSGTRRHSSPRLAGHVLRRQRMEALGVKQEKSTGIFPNRQMEKKIEKEFGKLTVKDQAVLLMSRRKLLGWLAVVSTGAGGLSRRFGPGFVTKAQTLLRNFRLGRLQKELFRLGDNYETLVSRSNSLRRISLHQKMRDLKGAPLRESWGDVTESMRNLIPRMEKALRSIDRVKDQMRRIGGKDIRPWDWTK